MLKRICRECGTEMIKKYNPGEIVFFCETCDKETEYDKVEVEPYCPDCGGEIEVCQTCCAGYFCNTCNSLKSSKRLIWKKDGVEIPLRPAASRCQST